MRNIVYVTKETSNTYADVLDMPYIVFLLFNYHLHEIEYEAMQAQIDMFSSKKGKRKTPSKQLNKHQTEPDMKKISGLISKGGVL